ncbi:DUF1287 domain-containing protein [Salipaludibacillus sp. CF4.18]|uniref:DUF1287 domain-containing protein n=1 Tax=Salipaludibacillus sp. CF4.18 TaxID=3373081 RepID=UPI003EE584AD
MKRKIIRYIFPIFITFVFAFLFFFKDGIILDSVGIHFEIPFGKTVEVPNTYSLVDANKNGIPDPIDIVNAARMESEQRTKYKSAYYAGGYPPENEGVCTDVIWRGLMNAGISLKVLMDEDIHANTELYPRVNGHPDTNIDFRRVPNQYVYFERFAESKTKELIPGDVENLKEWQPGDIVLYLEGFHHVGIISDKRAKDGTPYLIHNTRPFAAEVN